MKFTLEEKLALTIGLLIIGLLLFAAGCLAVEAYREHEAYETCLKQYDIYQCRVSLKR